MFLLFQIIKGELIQMMAYKKGLGDILIWVFAFIIIVLIMAGYLVYVGTLSVEYKPGAEKNKLSLSELRMAVPLSQTNEFTNVQYIDMSQNKTNLVESFLEKNYDIIFKWADSREVSEGDNINPEAEKLNNDLLNAYKEFIKDKGLVEPYFYIRTGNKEVGTEQKAKYDDFLLPMKPQENGYFIISNNGTLIMIMFYEQDLDKLYNE
jgi:hypothetical protein